MKIVQDRYSQIPLVIFAGTPGSGTKKQDMVDSEDQSFSKRGVFNGDDNPSLLSLKDAKLWSAMVMPPMASSCIAAVPVDVRVARTRPPMPIQKLAARRSCMPIKNEAVSAASRACLASLAPRCPIGSKKRNSASSLKYHPACPRSRRCRFHHAGTG